MLDKPLEATRATPRLMHASTLLVLLTGAIAGYELLETAAANAAVSHRSFTCGQSGSTTTLTLAKPAGVQTGDVLVASVGFANSATVATPSGWTQVPGLRGTVGSGQELVTWYRVAGASEPASYTFTAGSGTDAISGGISAYTGVDTAAPIAGTPGQTIQGNLTTSDTLPNSNGTAAGSMRISAAGSDDGTNATYSAGLTQMCDERNETGIDISTSTAYEPTGAGTTATRTVNRSDNARSVLHTLVLNPVPCGGGSLTLTPPASVTFPTTTLSGNDQTIASSTTLIADDETGTGSGWNVSATSTTFTSGGGHTLPTTATTINGVTPTAGSGRCSAPTSAITYPVVLPAASSAPAAVKIFNSAANTGKGPTNLAFALGLFLPAHTRTGSYTSTWTFTLATGP